MELRPPSRQGPAFGRIVETTQGRPGGLEGTPSPAPQRLLIGARGSQGPSGRPATRGTPPNSVYTTTAGKGLKGYSHSHRTSKKDPPEERSGGQVAPSILVSPPGGGSDRSPLTDIPVSGQNRVRIIYRNGPTKSARRPQPKAQTTSATSGSASWHTTKTSAHAHPEQLTVVRTASSLRTAVARRARRHGRGTCATECIGATRGLGSWRKTICT